MSLQKLPDNAKYVYTTNLYPRRSFSVNSGSTSGELYVFPNRSETQKDNIDSRFLGTEGDTIIRGFSGDSLEQRRIDIYSGNFSYLQAGAFVEPEGWAYTPDPVQNPPSQNGDSFTATTSTKSETFTYRSGSTDYVDSQGKIYTRLPAYPDQKDSINYEPALALLLDGANPLAEDHAWRFGLDPNRPDTWGQYGIVTVNDSASGYNTGEGVFSGYKIEWDEDGYPYQSKLISEISEVDQWPPEIKKWGTSVNGNFIVKGYSDYSMHPRNKTKKEIKLYRSTQDYFSKGSIVQRTAWRNDLYNGDIDMGWWSPNKHALTMQDWVDVNGVQRSSIVGYNNGSNDEYGIDATSAWTMEYWVKPTSRQIDEGMIVYYPYRYGVSLVPNTNTFINGVPQTFSIKLYLGDTECALGLGNGYTVETDSFLLLDKWHRVQIRYSPLFNNGKLDVFIDDQLVSEVTNIQKTFNITGNVVDLFLGAASTQPTIEDHYTTASINYTHLRFYSELAKAVCYNSALTRKEMLDEVVSESTDPNNYIFAITMQFDPSSDGTVAGYPTVVPSYSDASGNFFDTRDEWYQNAEIISKASIPNPESNPMVPYHANTGHLLGMPIMLVNEHLKERVRSEYPHVAGFDQGVDLNPISTHVSNNFKVPDFSVVDNMTYSSYHYPEFNGMTPNNSSMLYFLQHWPRLEWLRSYNSMIKVSDCPYTPQWSISQHSGSGKNRIDFYGKTIGNKDNDDSLKHFMDDEVYVADLDDSNGSVSQDTHGTEGLWEKLRTEDFLPPFSVIIDIPNLYYGTRITEGTVTITADISSGENISLRDSNGSIYYGDPKQKAKVGTIDYINGVIVVYHPSLSSMGLSDWSIEFKGFKQLFVKQYDLQMNKGVGTISNNPSFKQLKASSNSHDKSDRITMVSNIYLHDNNLNVLAKASLASSIVKRSNDSFLFRLKLDF